MVISLDDAQGMRAGDPSGLLAQLASLPDQLEWAGGLDPSPSPGADQVVVCGVGGSAIAGDVAADLLSSVSPVPIIVSRDVALPAFTGPRTLAVVISYSGNTAESLNLYGDAQARGCRLAVITSGGKLEALALSNSDLLVKVPGGNQPRASTGYLLGALATLLQCSGIGRLRDDLVGAAPGLRSYLDSLAADRPTSANPAKKLALALNGNVVAVYAPRSIRSLAVRWQNQINENAKSVAFAGEVPEMDHNQLVGWLEGGRGCSCRPALLMPGDMHPTVRTMAEVTLQMLNERGLDPVLVPLPGEGQLENLLQGMLLGDMVSYYLAVLKGVDPAPVSVITEFKRRIAP